MTTRDLLLREIDQLDETELEELFALVRQFLEDRRENEPEGFLERLGKIQISGPEDLSENLDLYLRGEKSIDSALH